MVKCFFSGHNSWILSRTTNDMRYLYYININESFKNFMWAIFLFYIIIFIFFFWKPVWLAPCIVCYLNRMWSCVVIGIFFTISFFLFLEVDLSFLEFFYLQHQIISFVGISQLKNVFYHFLFLNWMNDRRNFTNSFKLSMKLMSVEKCKIRSAVVC